MEGEEVRFDPEEVAPRRRHCGRDVAIAVRALALPADVKRLATETQLHADYAVRTGVPSARGGRPPCSPRWGGGVIQMMA